MRFRRIVVSGHGRVAASPPILPLSTLSDHQPSSKTPAKRPWRYVQSGGISIPIHAMGGVGI